MNPFLQTLYGALGTLGFCLVLNVRKEHWLPSVLNGAAAWAVYLLLQYAGLHVFLCAFGGALVAAAAAEVLAHVRKAPSIIFCLTGIVPLVPGSSLYYMMEAFVRSDYETVGDKAFFLLWTMLGIAAGCALIIAVMDIYRNTRQEC